VAICVLRVGMPDRPGALGAVASRIGAVRGDVVGIEILTRSAGRAMDEIAVSIDTDLLPLLLSEVAEVDGVVVENVRTLPDHARDRRLDAYRTAEALLRACTPDDLLVVLASRAAEELEATWVAIVDIGTESILSSSGRPPGPDWLAATYRRFATHQSCAQSHPSGGPEHRPADVIWATLGKFDATVGAGRGDWTFSDYEAEKLSTMARLADSRWPELGGRSARAAEG
jgi:hypothetical protein